MSSKDKENLRAFSGRYDGKEWDSKHQEWQNCSCVEQIKLLQAHYARQQERTAREAQLEMAYNLIEQEKRLYKMFAEFDQAVVVSGDGDFLCLYEYLEEKQKLLKILVPNKLKYSKLLKKFVPYMDFVSTKRTKLGYKK